MQISSFELSRMRFTSEDELCEWCRKNNYIYPRNKKNVETIREKRDLECSLRDLQKSKKKNNLDKLPHYSAGNKNYELYMKMATILTANRKIKWIYDQYYHSGLIRVLSYKDHFIRDVETYETKTHNRHKQFSDFLHHMFCKYRSPEFLEKAFLDEVNNMAYAYWFIQLGQGDKVKSLIDIPTMTKREAHHWLNTPDKYSIQHSHIYAQTMALGGNERLFDVIQRTRLTDPLYNKIPEFRIGLLNLFIRNPMFDIHQIPELMDYVHDRKWRGDIPLGFSLKGINIMDLHQRSLDWHQTLKRVRRKALGSDVWQGFDIKPFYLKRGKDENAKIYIIDQITTTRKLVEEGQSLSHCVGSYAYSCKTGQTSIWSMQCDYKRLLTIEVTKEMRIGQVRGKANRLASSAENEIIRLWASEAGIRY